MKSQTQSTPKPTAERKVSKPSESSTHIGAVQQRIRTALRAGACQIARACI